MNDARAMATHDALDCSADPGRRELIRLGLAGAASLALPAGAEAQKPKRRVPFGSASQVQTFREDARYREALARHCDIIVPMNDLKWEQLRHTRSGFDFKDADEQVAFARERGKSVRGHTLIWGLHMPEWTKSITTAREAERELINHINTVMLRYRGKIISWDVANEIVAEFPNDKEQWRPSIWLEKLGIDHVALAFRTAAAIDPTAKLVINDYNLESPEPQAIARRAALLSLVRRLKDRGVPIHGVGIQGHLIAERPIDTQAFGRFIEEFDKMGLDILVTELDVIDWRLPAAIAARDAAAAQVATTFLESIAAVKLPSSIVSWGLTDRYSWTHEVFKRKDGLKLRPLPFDAEYRPKPLWRAIEAFCAARA
ncbi:MAG: endo-1,4-beta-xylanase [Bosea sp. (in: a-proteobacteria)]